MKIRPPRFKKSKYFSVILLFCLVFQWPVIAQEPVKNRDGKFLRGEKWERFAFPEMADFMWLLTETMRGRVRCRAQRNQKRRSVCHAEKGATGGEGIKSESLFSERTTG